MNLRLDRPEQVAQLERLAGPASIAAADIADGAVSTAKLADTAVTTAKITDANVTTAKIADANVTTAKLAAGGATLPKVAFTGLKLLAADGVNATGGDTQVTLTGSVVGDRVIAIFGHTKANTGVHTFLIPVIGTAFEATISVVDKIVEKQAAGDLSANTYLFLLAPATA